jgi:hypothetical protein
MRASNKSPAKQPLTLKQSSSTNSDASGTGLTPPAASSASVTDDMHQQIAKAAYCRAEQRGFEPGHELEDWLLAEAEITGCALRPVPAADKPS